MCLKIVPKNVRILLFLCKFTKKASAGHFLEGHKYAAWHSLVRPRYHLHTDSHKNVKLNLHLDKFQKYKNFLMQSHVLLNEADSPARAFLSVLFQTCSTECKWGSYFYSGVDYNLRGNGWCKHHLCRGILGFSWDLYAWGWGGVVVTGQDSGNNQQG